MSTALRLVDRLFRVLGIVTIAALAATIAMLLLGAEAWRVPFVAAHLAALVALAPLGIVLIVVAYREAGGVPSMIMRHALVVAALAVIVVSVTVTGMEFTGNRDVRRIANIVTVSLVVLLVARYLWWFGRNVEGRV
ncbi:MAG: hypothetical protein WCQ48_08035 [Chloroflexota bacterium]